VKGKGRMGRVDGGEEERERKGRDRGTENLFHGSEG